MNKGTPTIVILTPAFPSDESETSWVPSQQLLTKAMKRNFPELNVIVLSFLYPYHRSEYTWNNIKVISFDGTHRRKTKRILFLFQIWKTLRRIKKENKLVGLFSFWCGECALVGKWFGKWNSVRHFCWVCGQDARKRNPYIKFIRPKASELVGISSFVAHEFYKNYGLQPQHVIPNGIDTNTFPLTTEKRDIHVLAVGSLTALKQYDRFLSIISKLKKDCPNVKVIHCGDGEQRKQITELIKKLELDSTVHLLYEQRHEEVLKLMQRSKILLHPSAYEGYSTVCLEALYAGAHVVSFCDPLDGEIPHWHVVATEDEMIRKTKELLQQPLDHKPVLVHTMDEGARAVMKLFDA